MLLRVKNPLLYDLAPAPFHERSMTDRDNDMSGLWNVGIMTCRDYWLSGLWTFGIMIVGLMAIGLGILIGVAPAMLSHPICHRYHTSTIFHFSYVFQGQKIFSHKNFIFHIPVICHRSRVPFLLIFIGRHRGAMISRGAMNKFTFRILCSKNY